MASDSKLSVDPLMVDALVVITIMLLSALAMILGFLLLVKGFQSGELLVQSGGVAGISGLLGYLGGRKVTPQSSAVNAVTTPTAAPASIQ